MRLGLAHVIEPATPIEAVAERLGIYTCPGRKGQSIARPAKSAHQTITG